MNLTITPHAISGTVHVISSKSLSHRYVIASGLAQGKSIIRNVQASDDLDATRGILKSFGVRFDGDAISGSKPIYDGTLLDCKESGSTLRFMIPLSMLQDKEVTFVGSGKLKDRPLDVYANLFQSHGYAYQKPENQSLPFKVRGPLKSGCYAIPGDVSSQFVTGLLYALPLVDGDSEMILTTPLESEGYVELTLDVLHQFGIQIDRTPNGFSIKGNQSYHPIEAEVEGDFSQAAFFMVAGLIGKKIRLQGLDPESKQGDRAIIDIIRSMGGKIEWDQISKTYDIFPSETFGTTLSLKHIPDLGPILMVLAALSKGKTVFKDCERLRLKESDRLQAMVDNLTKLGIAMEVLDNQATIHGASSFKGNVTVDAYGDHRIAMAMAIAAIRSKDPITIHGALSVSKSYPDFFKVYQNLGGIFHES